MAVLPGLSRNAFSVADIPHPDTSSTATIESGLFWMFAHILTGDLTGVGVPATVHIRAATANWIVRGSSNAVSFDTATAPGVAAANNYWWNGGVFPGAFTRGTNTTPHHWMLLENVNQGYELLLNYSQSVGYACISFAKTGVFSGGTLQQCPQPNLSTNCVQAGQVTWSNVDGGQMQFVFGGDTSTTGGSRYIHYTIADNGEFIIMHGRPGQGRLTTFWSLWSCSDADTSDGYNKYLITNGSVTTGRGEPSYGRVFATQACASQSINGAQKSTGGIRSVSAGGSFAVTTNGPEAGTGLYPIVPMEVWEVTPNHAYRGYLTDWGLVGTMNVSQNLPDVGPTMTRVVVGDIAVPFVEVSPTI